VDPEFHHGRGRSGDRRRQRSDRQAGGLEGFPVGLGEAADLLIETYGFGAGRTGLFLDRLKGAFQVPESRTELLSRSDDQVNVSFRPGRLFLSLFCVLRRSPSRRRRPRQQTVERSTPDARHAPIR